jgi:hypothetical protein
MPDTSQERPARLPVDTQVIAVDPDSTSRTAYIGIVTHHSTRDEIVEHVVEWRGGGTSFCGRDEIVPITDDEAALLRSGLRWRDDHDIDDRRELLDVLADPKASWTGADLISLGRLAQQAEAGDLWRIDLEGRHRPALPLWAERRQNEAMLDWMATWGSPRPENRQWTTTLSEDGETCVLEFAPRHGFPARRYLEVRQDVADEVLHVELAAAQQVPLLIAHTAASRVLQELDRVGAVARWPRESPTVVVLIREPRQFPHHNLMEEL